MKISLCRLISLQTILLLLQGCLGAPSPLAFQAPGFKERDDIQTGDISFCELKQKVLNNNCISCHQEMATKEGLAKFMTPGVPESSPLFLSVENGSMPLNRPPLNSEELEVIRSFIKSFKPEETLVDFEKLKKDVLIPYCLKCHNNMASEDNLKGWINFEDLQLSPLLLSIERGSMPLGADPLNEEQIQLVRSYLKKIVQQDDCSQN